MIKRNNKINGKPCSTTSNQSLAPIPMAPPAIHLSFPQIWGSGKNGAKPRVKHKSRTIFQLFINSFITICIIRPSLIKFYLQS